MPVPFLAVLFSSPLAAAAAAGGAAAVPILIHLLNRKRYVVVNWAAMRFLLAAQKKNVRRLKLEQWLLLAVRTLLVLILVLAMAAVMPWFEPVWQRLFPGDALASTTQGRTHRIIVLDASFTMAARREDDQSRWDAARARALEILEASNPGDGYSLVLLGLPAQVIVPGPADDRDKVAREIEALVHPHTGSDVSGGLHAAAEIATQSKADGKYVRQIVYLVSDLRRSAWPLPVPADSPAESRPPGTGGAADAWARLLDAAQVAALDVAGQDQDNLAVTALTLGDPLPLVHTDLAVSATVHNYGRQAREGLPVSLLLGKAGDRGTLVELGQQLVSVPPGTSVTVNFSLEKQNQFRQPGQYVLQVRLAEDVLALDNVRSLAVSVRDTIPVMVVNGKPSPDPLAQASGFLTRALNPFPDAERSVQSPANVRVLTTREFQDAGLGDLFRPDAPVEVVFLADLPAIGGNEAARLDAHLKRGGSVVIGLGPNAARNLDTYNRVLFDDGKGLLPGPLVGVRRAEGQQFFRLTSDEEAFQRPPLSAFRSERERSSFGTPHFNQYIRMDLPPTGAARRLFSFLPSVRAERPERPDPAVIEWRRHRGRVIVFTSSLNADWNDWPRTLSYPPFVQEVLRFAAAGEGRQTVTTGEPIDEYVPGTFVGLTATVTFEDGTSSAPIPVVSQDEAGLVRLSSADRAGVYRLSIGGKHDSVFAANVPVLTATGGAESDLRRVTEADFRSAVPDAGIQVAASGAEVQARPSGSDRNPSGESDARSLEPRGPAVARALLFTVLALMFLEVILAWRFGSARVGEGTDPSRVRPARWLTLLWVVPMLGCVLVLGVVTHAAITGELLGFLPDRVRQPFEQALGVPDAVPGEGTRWRLEAMPALTGDTASDHWLSVGLLLLVGLFVWQVYRRERPAQAARPIPGWRRPMLRIGGLRVILLALTLTVLLPQVKVAFEREGWPDVVVALDDSRSMSVVDTFTDPAVRAHADALKVHWAAIAEPRVRRLRARLEQVDAVIAKDPSSADAARFQEERARLDARIRDLRTPHRLNLIKAMLATGETDWLSSLIRQRQMRVHLYLVSGQATRIADLNDPAQCARLLDELIDLEPVGESSQLGNGVEAILKTFRGGSLNGLVLFTDGVTTRGPDLSEAARQAGRAGVPLFLVGLGDASESPDLALSDLLAEDVVQVNDRLVIDARISARGPGMPTSVPVTLAEIRNGQPIELARETVRPDPTGKPVKVRFVHQPREQGEKTFVIEVPREARPGNDVEPGNDRLEHRVLVTEARRLRVLLVEGYPRYDFRYIKALFERESDSGGGTRSIEVNSLLLSADPDHPKQDRTSISRFPTPEELRNYDVIIFGDVDPRALPKAESTLESVARFVKDQGGGLIMLAGEQSSPHAYRDTPLADVMPVVSDGPPPAAPGGSARQPYRPRLTPAGQSHPLFQFSTEEADNLDIWNRLPPIYWYAEGYRRKLAAEVLAVHPDRPAEATSASGREENHPLVLQQFVGAGRVLFIGFDDIWRWRLRQEEVRFNQFWLQAVQALARGRVGRTEVRTDRKTYRRDEPMRVTVRFPDDAPPPEGPVKLRVDRLPLRAAGGPAEGETQTIQLAPREGTRATFEALVTRTPEGEYSFTLSNPLPEGTPPRAETRVLPPPGEMDRVQLNESDLQRAARESLGAYYSLDRVGRVIDDLPAGPRVALDQPCEPLRVWNHPLMFALVLSLLTAEWVMRKKWRLL